MRDDAWGRERDLRRHVYAADVARLVGRGHSVRCSQMRLLCRGSDMMRGRLQYSLSAVSSSR